MQDANYEVRLYDHNRSLIYVVYNITKLKFGRKKNDIGVFSVALFGHDAQWALDYYNPEEHVSSFMSVFRSHPVTGQMIQIGCYLIREFNPWYDDSGQFYYQLGGFSLEILLQDRHLYAEEDPRYSSRGLFSITESGDTTTVIETLVDSCLGNGAVSYRQIPGFSIVSYGEKGRGGGRWDGEVLLDVVQELAESDDIDFYMWLNPTTKEIEFHVGEIFLDRRRGNKDMREPFVLSDKLDSLFFPSLVHNFEDEKNALYIKQDAEDDSSPRLFLKMQTASSTIPYNRREHSLNNTRKDESETNLKLITDGKAALKENEPSVNLEVPLEDTLSRTFLSHWEFGDKITVEFLGSIYDMQIDEVEIDVTDGQESVTPSITKIPPLAGTLEIAIVTPELSDNDLYVQSLDNRLHIGSIDNPLGVR